MANTARVARPAANAAKPSISAAIIAGSGPQRQQIVWTALPNGLSGSGSDAKLKLSIFVAPRLGTVTGEESSETLASYPDFGDWPSVVKTLKFSVQFEGGPTVDAMRTSVDPDSGLWTSLFKTTVPVKPFSLGDYHERPILSYPVGHVHSFIMEKYLSVAGKPEMVTQLPSAQHMASSEMFGKVAFQPHPMQVAAVDLKGMVPANPVAQITDDLSQSLKTQKFIPRRLEADPQKDFVQLSMFHTPTSAEWIKMVAPQIEFHEALSNLGKYPELMRKLGLVVDVEVPLTANILAGAASSTVKVVPSWPSADKPANDRSPKTKYKLTSKIFVAAPRSDSDMQDGLLKLSDPSFDVVQLDVDSAAMNSMNFANHVTAMMLIPKKENNDSAGLPALRSAGVSVIKTGRDQKMQTAVQTAVVNNQKLVASVAALGSVADNEVTLYADDVTRGFRVDVWDAGSKEWRSLCQRIGQYSFSASGTNLQIEDEGYVSTAVTRPAGDKSKDTPLRLHEAMFRWNGWSLCAPRPGKTILPDDSPGNAGVSPLVEWGLNTTFSASPGTLPKLRFGGSYRLRARVVDLAGNSLKMGDIDPADFSLASDQFTYTRFEPVSSPVVVPLRDLSAGQGDLSRRGNKPAASAQESPGESVERFVIRSYNDSPSKDKNESKETSDRHIAPPKTAQLTAETHSMFDAEKGLKKEDYKTITERDGTLDPFVPDTQLNLPFLPDPLAIGASLVDLPGASGKPTKVPFYPGTKWPEAQAFRVRIAEGSGAPQFDDHSRVLTVGLPKSEIATFTLSCYLEQVDLQPLGIWQWLQQSANAAAKEAPSTVKPVLRKLNFAGGISAARPSSSVANLGLVSPVRISSQTLGQIKDIAVEGRHWMLTPSRQITLVHAVQQPLMAPTLKTASSRFIGGTYAMLEGDVNLHGKSTGKIDVECAWDEPIDPISEDIWRKVSGMSHVFEETIAYGEDSFKYVRRRHDFGDTKYRKVRYTPVATTRFREYFPVSITKDPQNLTRAGEPVELDILSSARPAAPQVVYIIPTFAWESAANKDGSLVRKRVGGGLRVYLDRPWFSSGDGELLGVVLASQVAPGVSVMSFAPKPSATPYTTQWGNDPIWDSKATYKAPLFDHFKKAVVTKNNLSLDEVKDSEDPNGPKVSVAGHKVDYDPDRKLWYCDLEIDAGPSYWPFVRLALARFQPNSIDNAHLSRVIIADFAQLAPDRTAIITRSSKQIKVTVAGASYAGSSVGQQSSEVEVSLESRPAGSDSDLGWIPLPESTVQLQHPKGLLGFEQSAFWSGDVSLPAAGAGDKYRLVIREYERFIVDSSSILIATMSAPATGRRLVYADVIEL